MGFFDPIKSTACSIVDSSRSTVKASKSIIITRLTAIDYDSTISTLNKFKDKHEKIALLISCVEVIKEEVEIHSRSESETKDNELINGIINRIDIDVVIKEMEPLVKQLPAGFVLIMILKAIRSYSKKQSKKQIENE